MTYKKRIKEDLVGIYKEEIKSSKYKHYKKGYYITSELLKNITSEVPIENFAVRTQDFATLLDVTRATVSNRAKAGTIIYLQDGYYDKNGLLSYLLR